VRKAIAIGLVVAFAIGGVVSVGYAIVEAWKQVGAVGTLAAYVGGPLAALAFGWAVYELTDRRG
jgi:hypothetical protein